MKKLTLFTLVIIALLLTSCSNNDTKECREGEYLIENVCTEMSYQEYTLYQSINHSKELDNYTMNVKITEGDTRYDLQILVDENVSKVMTEEGSRENVFKKEDNTCFSKSIYNGVTKSENTDCSEYKDYRFFDNFSYQWFELSQGKYTVKSEFLTEVELLLNTEFENATLESLYLSILNDEISDIEFELLLNESVIYVSMNFSDVGTTEVHYEEVN